MTAYFYDAYFSSVYFNTFEASPPPPPPPTPQPLVADSLSLLRDAVNRKMKNWKFWATYRDTGDGSRTDFALPVGNVVANTLTATVNGTATVPSAIDLESGWATFSPAPADAAVLSFRYQCRLWTDEDVDAAINAAVRFFWSRFAVETTTTITTSASTYEYALPAGVAYISRIQYLPGSGSPQDIHTGFDIFSTDGVRYVRFYKAPPAGTMRIIYFHEVGTLVSDTDTLETSGNVNARARDAVVYFAVGWLLENVVDTKMHDNAFLNAEGGNAIKTWDILRASDSSYARANMFAEADRATPHISRL
jgi:hypothetical protein